MADQTTVNGRRSGQAPARLMRDSMSEFAHDLTELGELQAALLAVDLKQTARRLIAPTGLALCGLLLLAGCFPVLVAGLAIWFAQGAGLSYPAAFAATFGVGAAVSGLIVLGAALWVRSSLATLERSKHELRENMSCIKRMLKRDFREFQEGSP